uniref:RING-type domain-containing protein n=2 Tax=Guillardia theta TaxID=55529 RepID=A0A7S4NNU7_GUITH|mmetsp:Transcript_27808/g.90460  ORF Transcript_27808/g.90460 Transcript_27808/m.90460 type:complete len:345 (+) Transcript_27808:1968-3002(+)
MKSGGKAITKHYTSLFECVLRLRQVCNALHLLPKERLENAKKALQSLNKVELNVEEAEALLKKLQGAINVGENEDEALTFECCICLDDLDASLAQIIRQCGHCFCSLCLQKLLASVQGSECRCPLCRSPFTRGDFIGATELNNIVTMTDNIQGACESASSADQVSPKVQVVLQELNKEWEADPSQKAVIFSQFTGMLSHAQEVLAQNGIQCLRIDGSLSLDKRTEVLRQFDRDDARRVLLVSLKAGGTGINLVRANLVFMLDQWWNYGVEEQAMDRVHRIGQTRRTRIVRMVCQDTVEEKILQLQESKQLLGKGVTAQLSAEEAQKARIADLRTLLFGCGNDIP